MNEENGQHEFNFFLDKQIQQRLLDADDELDAKGALPPQTISNNKQKSSSNTNNSVHVSLVNNGNKNNNSQSQSKHLKEIQTLPLAGWCAESNITYRKAEGDGSSKTKGNAGVNNRESLVSRDTRHRPQASQDFVFRHYTDPRRYIEQYRREHVCYDTANSSATKSEFLDSRRFYAYNQYSPLAVCTQNGTFQQSTTLPPSQQESSFGQASEQQPQSLPKPPHTPTIHYTTRKDQSKHMLHATLRSNSQQKHKLSNTPGSKSETTQIFDKSSEVPEKFDSREHSKRAGSAKDGASSPAINGLSLQKAAASKVNVPSSNSGVVSARNLRHQRSRSPSDPNLSNQFVSHKLGPSSSGSSRTLDTLACVAGSAGEKQKILVPNSGLQETLVASSQARLESFRHVNKKRTPKLRPPQLQLKFFGQDRTRSPQLSSQPDCRRMSRSLQQPLRCSPDHDPLLININNNADDTTIGGDDVDEDGVNEENNTDGGRYVKKSVKGAADLNMTSERPSWKERSLMAMKEQDKKHPHMFYDRWAVAKKNEERMLISHKRRIKHLMEQSRLKSKFGQLLSQVSDTATKKTTMEVPSIHISDPFMVAEANTDANCNNSNVRRSDMSVKDHVQGTHSNEGISYRDDDGENYGDNSVISSFEENIIFQYRQNPEHNKSQCNRLEAGDAASYQILDEWERILPKTLKREFDSHTKKGYSKKHDHEFAGVDFFSHFHTTQDATSKTPLKQVTFNNKLGNSLCVERNDDSGPSGKNNSGFSSVNKRMGKLAEQMSATVSFRVPKFKYSSLTELNRSQTMNL